MCPAHCRQNWQGAEETWEMASFCYTLKSYVTYYCHTKNLAVGNSGSIQLYFVCVTILDLLLGLVAKIKVLREGRQHALSDVIPTG